MARDHIRIAITQQLAPVLSAAGFTRTQPKHFMSVTGDLVRHVGFQMSQYGGQSFYLHLYVNTLLNPLGNLHGYRVGRRFQNYPEGKVPWQAATAETADAAIGSVVSLLQNGPLAWLSSVKTLRDYTSEYVANPQTASDDFELALVLAREGHTNRPWWSAEKLIQEKANPDESDHCRELRVRARLLQTAINANTMASLLNSWRSEYLVANKLTELAS